MKLTILLLSVLVLFSLGVVGCGAVTSPPTAGSVTADDSAAALDESVDLPEVDAAENNGDAPANAEISAEIASWKETQEYVASQKGKVVVLDAWSTSCLPCIKELPNLVALQKRYPEQVVCVTLNLDYYGARDIPPEASREAVLKRLRAVNATMHNIISSTADEAIYDSIDLGSIPAVFVYAPDGTLKKRFDNDLEEYGKDGFSYEQHIVPLVEELLPKE